MGRIWDLRRHDGGDEAMATRRSDRRRRLEEAAEAVGDGEDRRCYDFWRRRWSRRGATARVEASTKLCEAAAVFLSDGLL